MTQPDLYKTWRIFAPHSPEPGIPIKKITILTLFVAWWALMAFDIDDEMLKSEDVVATTLAAILAFLGGMTMGNIVAGWWFDRRGELRDTRRLLASSHDMNTELIGIARKAIEEAERLKSEQATALALLRAQIVADIADQVLDEHIGDTR